MTQELRLGNKVPTKTVPQAGNKIVKHISLWATLQTQSTFPKVHGHLMMSNALSSMWRGSESKLSQHCLKVWIQIPSHLRAYSQLWVTVTSTIKLYTSNTQRHGANVLSWKTKTGPKQYGNSAGHTQNPAAQSMSCLQDTQRHHLSNNEVGKPWFSVSAICSTHMVPPLVKLHLVTLAFLNLRSSWGFHCDLRFTLTASHQLTQGRESGISVPFTPHYCFWEFGDAIIHIIQILSSLPSPVQAGVHLNWCLLNDNLI